MEEIKTGGILPNDITTKTDDRVFPVNSSAYIAENGGEIVRIIGVVDENTREVCDKAGNIYTLNISNLYKSQTDSQSKWEQLMQTAKGIKFPSRQGVTFKYFTTKPSREFNEIEETRKHEVTASYAGGYFILESNGAKSIVRSSEDPKKDLIDFKNAMEQLEKNKHCFLMDMTKNFLEPFVAFFANGNTKENPVDFREYVSLQK